MSAVVRAEQAVAKAEVAWHRAPSRRNMSRLIAAEHSHAAEQLHADGHHEAAALVHPDTQEQP